MNTDDDLLFSDWPEGRWPNPPKGPCAACGTRPATVWFVPEGAPDANHGGAEARCERCCLASAIKHCEEAAARLPKLRGRLAEIDAEERPSTPPVEQLGSDESPGADDDGGRCGTWHDW